MKILSPLLILLTIICTGCPHPLGMPDRNLKTYVQDQDVVGVWSLQPESLSLLTRDGFKADSSHMYQIQFQADGACSFRSVVDEFSGGTYHDAKGEWKLEHDTTGGSNIEKKNTIEMNLSLPNGRHIQYLNFDKVDGSLVLWQFYGDPDSWEFMEYKKAEQEN
jgi:hypothetical protein